MFLFEKSLINAYCNWLYDLVESHGPLSCYGRITANSAGENRDVTNNSSKTGPPIRPICLPLNSSFLYDSKRPPFGRRNQV